MPDRDTRIAELDAIIARNIAKHIAPYKGERAKLMAYKRHDKLRERRKRDDRQA